ncbi:MAG TPA: DUF5666 domain-containing protein [Thermoanaerobaculia bacterium]|nr:DUF5666 domain-containing protein [Thermoanaerobaculia bacterium]
MIRQQAKVYRIAFAFFAVAFLSSSLFGQTRPAWQLASDVRVGERGSLVGTVTQVNSSGASFLLAPDAETTGKTVRVTTEAVTTRYYGFGAGAEVLSGSVGFNSIRTGDRLQVTGIGRSGGTLSSTDVMLLGRQISPTSPATTSGQSFEGVVRQITQAENRLVIETTDRRLLTVYGTESTPVYYRGEVYRIRNIEVGDRIRVQVESSLSDGVRARIIDVIADVNLSDGGRTLTSVSGRVTGIDTRAQTLRIDAGTREVRVDTRNARDPEGRAFRLTDLKVGDSIEVNGTFDAADNFRASTIRLGTGSGPVGGSTLPTSPTSPAAGGRVFETLVIYGTVQRALGSVENVQVRDTDSGRDLEVHLVGDFVVRLVNGSYVTADQLAVGTRVVIQAFRDRDGQYIAQTIRTR